VLPVPTGATLVVMRCSGADILAVFVVGLLIHSPEGTGHRYDVVFDGFVGHKRGATGRGPVVCTRVTRSHSIKYI
jgi:hypothetical protein